MENGPKVEDPVGEEKAGAMNLKRPEWNGENITEVINYIRSEFKKGYYNYPLSSFCEINQGPCEDFADAVQEWIPSSEVVSTSYAMEFYPRAMKKGMKIIDADEEEIRYMGKKFNLPPHYWVFYKGRHYDAENPLGVSNWLDLPLFRRAITKMARGR